MVSPHDKTINTGAAKVILSLLLLYGILKINENEPTNADDANLLQLSLAENYKERYLLMVRDGLPQMRAKQFSDLIDETSTSYGPRHEVTVMLQKALDQVVFIPGNLHSGGFHIMQIVYNLFYGSILQKV